MINRRVRTTLVFGLLAGLAFIPALTVAGCFLGSGMAFRVIIAFLMGVYAFMLARWGRVGRLAVLFPVMALLAFAVMGTHVSFLVMSIIVLGWVRSGVCFQGPAMGRVLAEAALGFGGGLLLHEFSPQTPLTWALGIWLFFLVQSLYFVLIAPERDKDESGEADGFDQARRRAEAILSGRR